MFAERAHALPRLGIVRHARRERRLPAADFRLLAADGGLFAAQPGLLIAELALPAEERVDVTQCGFVADDVAGAVVAKPEEMVAVRGAKRVRVVGAGVGDRIAVSEDVGRDGEQQSG